MMGCKTVKFCTAVKWYNAYAGALAGDGWRFGHLGVAAMCCAGKQTERRGRVLRKEAVSDAAQQENSRYREAADSHAA